MVEAEERQYFQAVRARIKALGGRGVRDRQRCFWAEGIRNFISACDAGLRLEVILYSPILLKCPLAEKLIRQRRAAGEHVLRVSPEEFRTVGSARQASGVGAIARQHWRVLSQATLTHGCCWLVISHLRTPGNLGTILRTAEAVNVRGVIFVGELADPFDPGVVRASMGGLMRLPIFRTSVEAFQLWVEQHDVDVIGLSPDGERQWSEVALTSNTALFIGEERAGLKDAERGLCDSMVSLPIAGKADSLNVAAATSVMLYEFVRRGIQ